MPSEEKLWDTRAADLWEDTRASRAAANQQMTMRKVVVTILIDRQEQFEAVPSQISGFTALLITHAANVHIMQFVHSFSPLLATTFSSLSRRHAALGNGHVEPPETAYPANADTPLAFNCHALLRIAHVRPFGTGSLFKKTIQLIDVADEISATVASFVAALRSRGAASSPEPSARPKRASSRPSAWGTC